MWPEAGLEKILDELPRKYIGLALYSFRITNSKTEKILAGKLQEVFSGNNINEELIKAIEKGNTKITFVQLRKICTVLKCSLEDFLMCARFLRDLEKQPYEDPLQAAVKELEYQLWRAY